MSTTPGVMDERCGANGMHYGKEDRGHVEVHSGDQLLPLFAGQQPMPVSSTVSGGEPGFGRCVGLTEDL